MQIIFQSSKLCSDWNITTCYMRPSLFWDVNHYQHTKASTTLQQEPEISQTAARFDSFLSLSSKFNYLNQKHTNTQCQSTFGSQVLIMYSRYCEVKNIPKKYSNFKICDIHYANYVRRCEGKLSSQNQDQYINKRIQNVTPNQMKYMTPIIALWVTKKEPSDSIPILHQVLILWNQQCHKILWILTL
jgi:hypothetical protein